MPAVKMLIFKSLVRLLLQSVQEKNAKKSVFFQNSACNAIKCVIYYGDVKALYASPSSRGLGHRVFIPATRVRLPLEMPFFCLFSEITVTQSPQKASNSFRKQVFPLLLFLFALIIFCFCKKWDCSLSMPLPCVTRPLGLRYSGTSSLRSSWRCHFFCLFFFNIPPKKSNPCKKQSMALENKFSPPLLFLFALVIFALQKMRL